MTIGGQRMRQKRVCTFEYIGLKVFVLVGRGRVVEVDGVIKLCGHTNFEFDRSSNS